MKTKNKFMEVKSYIDQKCWYFNGKLHRKDAPAIEWTDGDKEWYVDGVPHRKYGPAIEYAFVMKEWYVNGKRHREDGHAFEDAYDVLYCVEDIQVEIYQLPKYYLQQWNHTINEKSRFDMLK